MANLRVGTLGIVRVTGSHSLDTGVRKDKSVSRRHESAHNAAELTRASGTACSVRHDFHCAEKRTPAPLHRPRTHTSIRHVRALLNEGGRGHGVAQRLRHTRPPAERTFNNRHHHRTTQLTRRSPIIIVSSAARAVRNRLGVLVGTRVFSPAGRSGEQKAMAAAAPSPFSPPPPQLASVGNGETRAARSGKRSVVALLVGADGPDLHSSWQQRRQRAGKPAGDDFAAGARWRR